jgi:hypothetical protein
MCPPCTQVAKAGRITARAARANFALSAPSTRSSPVHGTANFSFHVFMNVIAPSAQSTALRDRYARLAPDAKLILRLKSLIVPAVAKAEFAQCLARTGLRTRAGKVWTAAMIAPVINDLLSQGLLNANLECVPELLHPVAADAGASADAEVLAKAIRLTFPAQSLTISYRSYIEATQRSAMHRLIRLEIYTNDDVEFRLNRNHFDKTYGPQLDFGGFELSQAA